MGRTVPWDTCQNPILSLVHKNSRIVAYRDKYPLQETAELRPMEDKPKLTEEDFFRRLHLILRRSLSDGSY
jgi:hypothetical protein